MPEPVTVFTSRVVPLPAENVDTDQVIPARYLKTTEKSGLAEGLFHDWRFTAAGDLREPPFVLDRPEMQGRRILLAGANFGSGSSREHAPWALLSWGIRAVVSTGFADIFRANSLKNGLLPIVVSPTRHAALFDLLAVDPDVELTIDLEAQEVRVGGGPASAAAGTAGAVVAAAAVTAAGTAGASGAAGAVTAATAAGAAGAAGAVTAAGVGAAFAAVGRAFAFEIDPFARKMLLEGTDEIGYVLGRLPSIEAWEATHPARVHTLG